jgi:hypothetical protein
MLLSLQAAELAAEPFLSEEPVGLSVEPPVELEPPVEPAVEDVPESLLFVPASDLPEPESPDPSPPDFLPELPELL